jgi:DNA-binding response OmpR family regulator
MTNIDKKILIVDDSKDYVYVISQKLIKEGFSIITAEDGEEGLFSVQRDKPDLILLDIEMPKMDGITMATKLKELNIDLPIIFLTNKDDLKNISDSMETATEYIIKADVDAKDVVARVKKKLNI